MANPRQLEINHMNLQMASAKIPPSWGPETERAYPFRVYEQDAVLWTLATDLPQPQHGPAMALRLSGSAREVIRELDPNILVNGQQVVDPVLGQLNLTGSQALLRILRRRFAPLDQESQLFSLTEFFSFQRLPSEDIDSLISRFEVRWHRANNIGGVVMNEVALSWMLLQHAGVPKDRWPLLLTATQGNLPSTTAEYQAFVNYLRRNGHLFDRNSDPAKNVSNTYVSFDASDNPSSNQQPQSFTSPVFAAMHSHDMNYDGTFSDDDTDSSGMSYDSQSDVDLSDLHDMPYPVAAETAYLGYRFAKRRWRKFANPRRNPKGKGRGKGIFRRKARASGGKGHSSTLFSDGSDLASQWAFWKGHGKGKGKGKGDHPSSSYFGRKKDARILWISQENVCYAAFAIPMNISVHVVRKLLTRRSLSLTLRNPGPHHLLPTLSQPQRQFSRPAVLLLLLSLQVLTPVQSAGSTLLMLNPR